ncbi:hypothetical protein GlitD10_1870 [Gloeomargarita lithophora Alchichica-D10]|uniref:DUF2808 domain-containing protein n=1 Tax=Gloeomargarita lithophora Alchichica-D10 TaxID=1188229 RepID=A0A1J0AE34_9CYAN|nr:DUF2808 domain-containing protein [Gloeomargarita lithophora]APB34196.1 hypothetical protein GlitD10_1870 [Gloeomargarita lithophora Alchichica-D10]
MIYKRLVLGLLATLSVVGGAGVAVGQGSGWTLWGGPKKELRYSADSGQIGQWDRYYLNVPRQSIAVAEYYITYPQHYRGELDPKQVEVVRSRSQGKDQQKFRLGEAVLDQENRLLRIALIDPVPADTPVDIVLSNVRNPRNSGMFFFNLQVLSPGDIPLPRQVGTWVITMGVRD